MKEMRAQTVNQIPPFDDLYASASVEIVEYINKCKDTPQSPKWHPEGDVGIHLRLVYDRAREFGDLNLALAAFFHDLGKVDTTFLNNKGTYSAVGHERVSARLVKKYERWISELGADTNEVYEIVKEHMRIKLFSEMRKPKQELLKAHPYFDKLNQFTKFDSMKSLTDEELNRYK